MKPASRQRLGKHVRVSDPAMQRGDVVNNRGCFPWGLCRVFVREVNSESRRVQQMRVQGGEWSMFLVNCED
jgi:hypothetical protein